MNSILSLFGFYNLTFQCWPQRIYSYRLCLVTTDFDTIRKVILVQLIGQVFVDIMHQL